MWITRFIPRYFSRVCLLGRLNFEIISKYILLLLSTDNKKMQIIITIDNSWGGGAVEGGVAQQGEVSVFLFFNSSDCKVYTALQC